LLAFAAVLHAQTNTAEKSIPQQHTFQELEGKFFSTNPDTALNHYITALKSAQEKGDKKQIALAHIGIALLNNYIGKQAETARIFRYYLYDVDGMNDQERDFLRLGLANAYIETRKMDSAYILIREGLQTSERGSYQYHEYLGLQGFYDLQLKKYPSAAHSLSECRKFFFIPENAAKRNQNYTLLHLGRSYAGLDETEKAVECFRTIDSLVVKTGYLYPELKDAYTYLIHYYKEKKDQGKQLYYMERFMEVDRVLDSQIRAILKELPGKYSISELREKEETVANEVNNRKNLFYIVLSLLVISHLLFINFYLRYKKTGKKYRKIAQDLIQSVDKNKRGWDPELKNRFAPEDFSEHNTEAEDHRTAKAVSEDIAQAVLKELDIFEDRELFLNKGITLGTLAKKVKTNSRYLSEIINTYKDKNFATYLNDLRIDYAISRLANDRKFRSYKIPFIAEELGYNNEQAFTLAFKKRTGTPLSIYLKEIENIQPD
jgi:AraC-like DNA-binding protein